MAARRRPLLVGIARLAAQAPREAEKHAVEYFRLPVRSVLNRVVSERVDFGWSINPYRGCEFGCQYCYARYTHEYMELGPAEFERKIYVKENASRVLARDLKPEKLRGEHIAIGTATDPYQPAERMFGVTRQVLETLLTWSEQVPRGLVSFSLTTKSNLVVRDAELLARLHARQPVHINFSVTTLKPRLARLLEPRAPRPDLRLEALRQLREAGLVAGVFLSPVLPGITDKSDALEAVVAAAAQAGACYLAGQVVFLMPSAQQKFFPFLREKFPRLVKQYRQWYARSGYAPAAYRAHIRGVLAGLRRRYHLAAQPPEPDLYTTGWLASSPQLALPFAPARVGEKTPCRQQPCALA